jgi:uncharacterized protein YbjT (DUF2867 family)
MIAVIGGTGFIGGAIVAELVRRGEPVIVISHSSAKPLKVAGQSVEVRRADVADRGSLLVAFKGVDCVVGAAQFKGFPNQNPRQGLTFEAVDHQGTVNAVAAARENGVTKYVYISGAGAAADSDKVWYRAKWGAEQAVRNSGLEYTIVRPSWVYGPGDNALNKYVGFVKSPLPVVPVIGNGRQRLMPVFVNDVARVAAEGAVGSLVGVFEIGGPELLTMDQVIRTVEQVVGKKKPLVHQPAAVARLLFSPKALWPALPLPLTPEGVTFATMDAVCDNSALLAAMPSLRLTPLREALATYLGSGRPARPASAGQ